MKYIALGYLDEQRWNALSAPERAAMIEECSSFDNQLRKSGHFIGGQSLYNVPAAATVRLASGQVNVTAGPLANSCQHLGGVYVLSATDLNHAIQLLARHPGVRLGGCFEIRPADELCPSSDGGA
jgi:Uncharacterized protein conserved in bacteria